jgi:hypothetical protein
LKGSQAPRKKYWLLSLLLRWGLGHGQDIASCIRVSDEWIHGLTFFVNKNRRVTQEFSLSEKAFSRGSCMAPLRSMPHDLHDLQGL